MCIKHVLNKYRNKRYPASAEYLEPEAMADFKIYSEKFFAISSDGAF